MNALTIQTSPSYAQQPQPSQNAIDHVTDNLRNDLQFG
jgi:hypothetical protein